MRVRMSTLPEDSQYLVEGYIGSYSQLLFTYPPDRMQNPHERKACHTKSLGRHSSRADKLVSTDHCRRLATLLDHQSIVHTARRARPSITDPHQRDIILRRHLVQQRRWSRT